MPISGGGNTSTKVTKDINSIQDTLQTIVIRGTATDGLNGFLEDTTKAWQVDQFAGKTIRLEIDNIIYYPVIISNTSTVIYFTPIELPTGASITLGAGGETEGQVTVTLIGDLIGTAGNDYSLEIVNGNRDTGFDYIELDSANKKFIVTVDTNALGETRELMSGSMSVIIADNSEVAAVLEAGTTFDPGLIPLTTTPIPFTGGDDGIYVSAGDTYEIAYSLVVDQLSDQVESINTIVGSEQLDTTAQTLTGAINEVEQANSELVEQVTGLTGEVGDAVAGYIAEHPEAVGGVDAEARNAAFALEDILFPYDTTTNFFNWKQETAPNIVDGYFVAHNGAVTANADRMISSKYYLRPGKTYTLSSSMIHGSAVRGAFYTDGDVWISSIEENTFTVPVNASYVRFNITKNSQYVSWQLVMLVLGNTVPESYIPYGTQSDMVQDTNTVLMAKNLAYDPLDTSISKNIEVTTIGTGSAAYIEKGMKVPSSDDGLKWRYVSVKAKVLEAGCEKLELRCYVDNFVIQSIDNPEANTDYLLGGVAYNNFGLSYVKRTVYVRAYYADSATQNGKHLVLSKGIIISCTDVFGAGYEPDSEDMNTIMSKFPDRYFPDTENIFSAKCLSLKRYGIRSTRNGAYIRLNEDGHFEIGSAPNKSWSEWSKPQYLYGFAAAPSQTGSDPIYNKIHGPVECDSMYSVISKFSRWTNPESDFGGHVFEGWNNLRTYRLTMLIGHNGREDEACIQVFAPPTAYENPDAELTAWQLDHRVTRSSIDGINDTGAGYFGKVRIGSDESTKGFVFRRKIMHAFGIIICENATDGLVLKSPTGNYFRLKVSDAGALSTEGYTHSNQIV